MSAFRSRAKKTDNDIAAEMARQKAEFDQNWREARVAEKKTEAERKRLTRDEILGAQFVRTALGWKRVRKVNAVTVSVDSGYSWADKVPFDKVLDVRL